MPIDPQSIPYAPPQTPQNLQFQGGPYSQIATAQIAKQPTSLDWFKGISGTGNDLLQNYLEQQRLQQQAPLVKAQTGAQQADIYGKLAPGMSYQQQQDYMNRLLGGGGGTGGAGGSGGGSTGQDQGYTMSGVSPSSPMPGAGPAGLIPSSGMSQLQGGPPAPGMGRQSPIGVQNSGISPMTGQPMSMAPQTQQDPFAHMHMDPSNPYALAGSPQGIGIGRPQAQAPTQGGGDPSQNIWQQIQAVSQDPNMPPQQRQAQLSLLQQQYKDVQDQGEASALSKMSHIQSLFKTPPTADDILPMVRAAGPGVLAGKALDLAGTQNKLTTEMSKFTTTEQNKAKSDAGKLYDDYASSSADAQAAKSALSQAQQNPAVFNEALLNVGKVLGVTSRNPKFALEAVAAGDPSVGGQIQEYLSKKTGGRVSPQLLSGLNNLVDQTLQSKQSAFESKANAHSQRNAAMFGNDVNQAKQSLFPNYQWGSTPGAQPRTNTTSTQGAPDTITVRTPDGKTQTIFARNLNVAKQRVPGLTVVTQ